MIILHRKKDHPKSDTLEEKLTDMVLAFDTIEHPPGDSDPDLPYLEESGKTIKGDKNIGEWLTILEGELTWQRSLSGDACYIDPKTGKNC